MVFLGDLDPDAVGPGIEFATHYEPTPLADFAQLMNLLPTDFEVSKATFVDIGSGMGRAVMLASHFAFKQIVGVEISPALHEIALENMRRYRNARVRCRDIRLVREDASTYALPPGNLALYLYNPFQEILLERILEHVFAHARLDVVLIYHTPVGRRVIEENSLFELIGEAGCGAVYRARLP
ncbi:MAG: hypothetical protein NVSMB31_08010 [Vulcanimicrobiaceae bacterium]